MDLPIIMRYGREDCPEADSRKRISSEAFPNPKWGLKGLLDWCKTQLELSSRECVAVLGEFVFLSKYISLKIIVAPSAFDHLNLAQMF